MLTRRAFLPLAAAPFVSTQTAIAQQDWPTKPITLIYPFGAGATDALGRAVASAIEAAVGKPVVLEFKPGAGGLVGGAVAARAKPDGHTLLYATSSALSGVEELFKSPPYKVDAFDPVIWLGDFPVFLFVRKDFPAKTIAEFVAYARANPGKINMAVATNLARIMVSSMEKDDGVSFERIYYKTDPDTMTDVLAGRIDAFWATGQWTDHVASGALRALVVTTDQRSDALPGVPTLVEAGRKPVPVQAYVGIAAPAGTPKPIIERLNKILVDLRLREDFKKAVQFLKLVPAPANSSQDFRAMIVREAARWKDVVPMAGIEKQ